MEQTPGGTADLVAFHWHIRKKSSKLICLAASTSDDFCLLGAIQMYMLIDWLTETWNISGEAKIEGK